MEPELVFNPGKIDPIIKFIGLLVYWFVGTDFIFTITKDSNLVKKKGDKYINKMDLTNKKWPENNNPANFEDIVKPIKDLLIQTCNIKTGTKELLWKGLDIGKDEKATNLSPSEQLKSKALLEASDQGLDVLDIIIGISVRLGIEQGRRISNGNSKGI